MQSLKAMPFTQRFIIYMSKPCTRWALRHFSTHKHPENFFMFKRTFTSSACLFSSERPSANVERYWQNLKNSIIFEKQKTHTINEIEEERMIENQSVREYIRFALHVKKQPTSDILPEVVTRNLMSFYQECSLKQKERFFIILSEDFGIDRKEILTAIERFQQAQNQPEKSVKSEERLRRAATPLYRTLISQFCTVVGGVQFVVQMREDLLKITRKNPKPNLLEFEANLKEMLLEMFSVGFLELKQISWRSPALHLEQIYKYEAVHGYKDWQDMKRRVSEDRRVYAFFHDSMPDMPLVVVHTALTDHAANNVQGLLQEPNAEFDPNAVNTAVFYSISSTQPGLSGAELGNFLIKRVVKELIPNFENLRTFVTLSPIPNFRKWLLVLLRVEISHEHFVGDTLTAAESDAVRKILPKEYEKSITEFFYESIESGNYRENENTLNTFQPILLRLCARYLCVEKKKKAAIDPVANFHIRNGASVYRICSDGDLSEKGLERSFGIMVNYRYVLSEIEENNEKYLLDGDINISTEVKEYL